MDSVGKFYKPFLAVTYGHNKIIYSEHGATALGITTFSITTHSIRSQLLNSALTTLSRTGLIATRSINNTQHFS